MVFFFYPNMNFYYTKTREFDDAEKHKKRERDRMASVSR